MNEISTSSINLRRLRHQITEVGIACGRRRTMLISEQRYLVYSSHNHIPTRVGRSVLMYKVLMMAQISKIP